MEGKINQANDNRKRRMMHQTGSHNTQKYRPNPSVGYAPRNNRPPMSRPSYPNCGGGNPRSGGNHNNNPDNSNNFNRARPKSKNNNNKNTAPRTGSNVVPVAGKDKS